MQCLFFKLYQEWHKAIITYHNCYTWTPAGWVYRSYKQRWDNGIYVQHVYDMQVQMNVQKWYVPEGAKIETFVDYYPVFADKTKIPALFKWVTIVTNSQDDAQKARVEEASHRSSAFNAMMCLISGDGRGAKKQVLNKCV